VQNAWYTARAQVQDAELRDAPWFRRMRESWRTVLPDVEFPSHLPDNVDETMPAMYAPSPYRETPLIFQSDLFSWDRAPESNLAAIILDNDIRALFYELLVDQLLTISKTPDPLSLRYLGGALRGPLQLAYAHASSQREAIRPLENRLQKEWRSGDTPAELPLWITAVLASAPADAAQVAERIASWRESASGFRNRRAEVEAALARGDDETLAQLLGALREDLRVLSDRAAKIGARLTKALVQLVGAPALIVKAGAAAAGYTELTQRAEMAWLRRRRPQLWLVADMSKLAGTGQNSLRNAAHAFKFPEGLADEIPRGFLSRLGQVAWVN
jgi:hypothetical protein